MLALLKKVCFYSGIGLTSFGLLLLLAYLVLKRRRDKRLESLEEPEVRTPEVELEEETLLEEDLPGTIQTERSPLRMNRVGRAKSPPRTPQTEL